MTGLTRKEIRRIRRDNEFSNDLIDIRHTPISQILHRWHTDSEFLTSLGSPMDLVFEGEGTSFSLLVKKYGGDVPPGAMRTELERIDAIEVTQTGRLRPTKRISYNLELHEKLTGGLTTILFPAALNLVHNLENPNLADWWANVTTHTKYLRDSDRGRYMRIANERIIEFAKSMDDMQAGYEALYDADSEGDPSRGRTLGVGLFYFEEDKSDSDVFD